jgi:fatty acid desaturase
MLALVLAACVGSFLSAVAAHNAVHCRVFRRRSLDGVWRCVLTLAYGHPVSAYLPAHNLSHHRHLETTRDVMRTSKARARWNFLNLVTFAPRVGWALTRAEVRYLRFAWRPRPLWRRQLLVEAFALACALVTLGALDWRRLVLLVLVPHAYAAWGIVTMNLLQHDGADPSSPHDHSRTFVGRWINWITFNNGSHAIHHEKPTLHWSLLPAAHARLVAPYVDPRLVERSFVAYAFRTFVYPGARTTYDGARLVPAASEADAPWHPS